MWDTENNFEEGKKSIDQRELDLVIGEHLKSEQSACGGIRLVQEGNV